jgi:hypothetical protein
MFDRAEHAENDDRKPSPPDQNCPRKPYRARSSKTPFACVSPSRNSPMLFEPIRLFHRYLDELMPSGDWREQLESATTSEERKAVLTDAFSNCLLHAGKYKYVCETAILRPSRDRPLYSLFYGTRHDTGIEVFRDCQVKALEEQSKMRAVTKVGRAERKTGQSELFHSLHDMAPEDDISPLLGAERKAAEQTLLALTPIQPLSILYKDLWPQVLARHIIRRPDVNKLAAALKGDGRLIFPDWERQKRVPQPNYRVQRASRA